MVTNSSTAVVVDTPSGIALYRLASYRSALKLEMQGIRLRARFSAYARAKHEYGFKGSRARVLAQLDALHEELLAAYQGNTRQQKARAGDA